MEEEKKKITQVQKDADARVLAEVERTKVARQKTTEANREIDAHLKKIGELEFQAGSQWSRLQTSDDLVVEASGAAYSPAIDGVMSFSTSNFIYLNEVTFELDSGMIRVDGAAGSFVEIEKEVPSPANFNCFFFGIGCGFDVRIEEDGLQQPRQLGRDATTTRKHCARCVPIQVGNGRWHPDALAELKDRADHREH